MNQDQVQHLVYLGIGSNIDPEEYLPRAIDCIRENLQVVSISTIWQSPAVGSSGPDYLNAVIAVKTDYHPPNLKDKIISYIEDQLGRVRTDNKYADRTIDIDILVVDNEVLDNQIWEYAHIAVPLSELNPTLRNKETGKTIANVAEDLRRHTDLQSRLDINY